MAFSLLGDGQLLPDREIVHITLHADEAAAGIGFVLAADNRRLGACLAFRVFGPIDEARQIATFEMAEAMHLFDQIGAIPHLIHETPRQDEIGEMMRRMDVDEDVGRRGGREPRPILDRLERHQRVGRRDLEQLRPSLRAECHGTQQMLNAEFFFSRGGQRRKPGAGAFQRRE